MTTNELRIGNLVYDEIEVCKVDAIFNDFVRVLCDNTVINLFEPKTIPITEEWLLKMGFENNHSSVNFKTFYNNGFDYRIELYSDGKVFFDELREIQYVHQLQNLYFALTGEELTIK